MIVIRLIFNEDLKWRLFLRSLKKKLIQIFLMIFFKNSIVYPAAFFLFFSNLKLEIFIFN